MSANLAQAVEKPADFGMEMMSMPASMGMQLVHAEMPCCAMHAAQQRAATRTSDVQPVFVPVMRPIGIEMIGVCPKPFLFREAPHPQISPPFNERSQSRRE